MDRNTGMKGKTCLVTGANSGIGKATATGLAAMAATVVMLCHDQTRGQAALDEIKARTGSDSLSLMIADLSSQQSIRRFAGDFKTRYAQLDVLINNAGVSNSSRKMTVDGIEATFAVNYLAPFLLTNLLLDRLESSAPSRIVNVASSAAGGAHLDFEDIQCLNTKYSSWGAYGRSKLAVIMFTYELARRLSGTGVTANCVHPGVIKTNLARDAKGASGAAFSFAKVFFASPEKGAQPIIYLATSHEVAGVTGKYFSRMKESRSNPESSDQAAGELLWQESKTLTGLAVVKPDPPGR
jgi:NAD(P)-dependent dehydrogenase (short-subunit alcohol dehydrogenase family)